MSDAAKSPLAGQVAVAILAVFDIAPVEAQQWAEGLAEEGEQWGGSGVALLDWNFLVRQKLGDALKWRSEADRQRFQAQQQPPARSPTPVARVLTTRPPSPMRASPVSPAPTPPSPVDATPVKESSALTDEEQALGFELQEVLHLADVPTWEQIVQVSLPVLDQPSRLDAKGRTPDCFRTVVVKVLGESDAIFRARHSGRRVYAHLRFGYGSCWSYATFGGGAAWHPVSDPYASARDAVSRAAVTQENPAVSVMPAKFPSRPAGTTP